MQTATISGYEETNSPTTVAEITTPTTFFYSLTATARDNADLIVFCDGEQKINIIDGYYGISPCDHNVTNIFSNIFNGKTIFSMQINYITVGLSCSCSEGISIAVVEFICFNFFHS